MAKTVVKPKYKIYSLGYAIEELLCTADYLKEFRLPLLKLSPLMRGKFRKDIIRLLHTYILNEEFKKALAQDIIEATQDKKTYAISYKYKTETEVYKYIKKALYRNDGRRFLSELQEYVKVKPKDKESM